MSNGGTAVSRASGGTGHNTINRRRIRIFFQRFAGTNARSGIAGLDFTITVNGGTPIAGRTPANGRVEILLAAGDTAILSILGSQYEVSLLTGGLHPVNELRGIQQRLNMLGYNAGPLDTTAPPILGLVPTPSLTGAGTHDVEGQSTLETELAITNFQSDNDPLFIDAQAGPRTQTRLRTVVRNAGGE